MVDIIKKREHYKKYRRQNLERERERIRKYDCEHRQFRNERAKERYYLKLEWYRSNVEALSCYDCGLSFDGQYWMADFHHTTDGSRNVGSYINSHVYNKVVVELNKGVFICPNCHRIRHRT